MHASYRTETDKLNEQLLFGKCRIGREAARDIARSVEDGHGFWDYAERKRAAESQSAPGITVVGAKTRDGAPRHLLTGQHTLPGEETPELAA